jgi:hypothetical protein
MVYTMEFGDFVPWLGAEKTYSAAKEAQKLSELEDLLEEVFSDSLPSETEVNDFLWFEADYVAERLGL